MIVAEALSPWAVSSILTAGYGADFLGVQEANLGLLLRSIHKLFSPLGWQIKCKESRNREGWVICPNAECLSQDLFCVPPTPQMNMWFLPPLHLSLDYELTWTFPVKGTMYHFGREHIKTHVASLLETYIPFITFQVVLSSGWKSKFIIYGLGWLCPPIHYLPV